MQMQTITQMALERADSSTFTRGQASLWVGSNGARLDALLKRAVRSGEVRRIKNGLFCLSDKYLRGPLDPLELAQIIHGPSYVSLERALSYHGWIPEAVYTITNATSGRSRVFDTPVGRFSYTRVPQEVLLAGVRRVVGAQGSSFFLAIPLKALADLVYGRRLGWKSMEPLIESLRVEEEMLDGLTTEDFEEVLPIYRTTSIRRFLLGLREELGR